MSLLAIMLLCSAVLRYITASDGFLHCWDERYHALVAKHLIEHPLRPALYDNPLLPYSIRNWPANHIWLHKQPLSLWLIAGSIRLFGLTEIAVRIPSLLLSGFGILLCFGLGRRLFNERVGLITAFLYAVNGLLLDLSSGRIATDHPDVCLSFFVLAAVYCGVRALSAEGGKAMLAFAAMGILTGAALLSKWLPGLIVYPVVAMIAMDKRYGLPKKQLAAGLLVAFVLTLLVFLPWQWYIRHTFPLESAWESRYNYLHFFEALEGQGEPWYYFINRIRIDYGELIYLPLLYFMVRGVRSKDVTVGGLLCWIGIPLIIFSVAATKMVGYLFVAAPAFFLLTAAFTDLLLQKSLLRSLNWLRVLLLVAFFVIPVRYCLERAKLFQHNDTQPQWAKDIKSWQPGADPKVVLLGYKASIEAMFYHNCIAYDYLPSNEEIVALQQKGYKIFVAGEWPDRISMLRNIGAYKGVLPPY
ncbi:ArnT family glycosyltransferase [Rurimicrobium arvi]|uniref:Glycosyltransferase RgtA/B/C/D-like domain-containing protein n=1 Tax=Rurimicrobium arvi TaxID=2049916 RepID=A0ABP8MRW0_9BACT